MLHTRHPQIQGERDFEGRVTENALAAEVPKSIAETFVCASEKNRRCFVLTASPLRAVYLCGFLYIRLVFFPSGALVVLSFVNALASIGS